MRCLSVYPCMHGVHVYLWEACIILILVYTIEWDACIYYFMGCLYTTVWDACILLYGMLVYYCMGCLHTIVWSACILQYGMLVYYSMGCLYILPVLILVYVCLYYMPLYEVHKGIPVHGLYTCIPMVSSYA